MESTAGVYVMRVASMLTGMHPQTIRKYERAGFLAPSRHYMMRMYSDEDITRLKMIKHLVNNEGLNMAGVDLVLKLRERLMDIKKEIISAGMDGQFERHFTGLLNDMLEMLGNY